MQPPILHAYSVASADDSMSNNSSNSSALAFSKATSVATPSPNSTRRGFTLVELLVVIATIGLLVSLLLPAIGSVRESAMRTQCASNMRQVGLAMLLYTDAHGGKMPGTSHTVSEDEEAWIDLLSPYMEDVDIIRICPLDKYGEERVELRQTSYTLNAYLTTEVGEDERCIDRDLMSDSQTMWVFELGDKKTSQYLDHVHSFNWFRFKNILFDNVYEAVSGEIDTQRHGEGSNYLYADGRVEFIDADTIKSWCEKATNSQPGPPKAVFNFVLPNPGWPPGGE